MNTNRSRSLFIRKLLACGALLLSTTMVQAQQTAPPPTLGQDTKGAPAVEETAKSAATANTDIESIEREATEQASEESRGGILGTATIKEFRRENGQVYQIELDHSAGPKQYIQETDSDGEIQSKGNDPEDTPNLPKWKLGSW